MKRFVPILLALLSPILLVAQTPTWRQVGPNGGSTLTALRALPSGTVLIGAPAGIFRSTDRGVSWSATSIRDLDITAIERDSNGVPYAVTPKGLWRSSDDGSSWERIAFADTAVDAVAIAKDGTIYLLHNASRFGAPLAYRSSDGGESWIGLDSLGSASNGIYADVVSTIYDSVVVVGGGDKLMRSTDRGSTWRLIHTEGIIIGNGNDPRPRCRAVVAVADGISLASWVSALERVDSIGEGLETTFPIDGSVNVLARLDDSTTLLGGRYCGLQRSIDYGATWDSLGLGTENITAISDALDGGIYAATPSNLFRSDDGGVTWQQLPVPLRMAHIKHLVAVRTGGLYASTDLGELKSLDGGTTWLAAEVPLQHLTVTPTRGLMTIDLDDHVLYHSSDGGSSWATSPIGNTKSIGSYVWRFHAMRDGLLFLQRHGEDLPFPYNYLPGTFWRTTDSGMTWKQVSDVAAVNAMTEAADGTLLAGRAFEAYSQSPRADSCPCLARSTDRGATWTNLGAITGAVNGLLLVDNTLYAGTASNGIWRSSDNGNSWMRVNAGLDDLRINSLAANSRGDLFASTESHGVYRSNDGGDYWEPYNDGLWFTRTGPLAIDSNDVLYVGTEGASIFRTNGPTVSVDRHDITDRSTITLSAQPNPFDDATTISIHASHADRLRVVAYDILGRHVATLYDDAAFDGAVAVTLDGSALPAGSYHIVATAGEWHTRIPIVKAR